LRQELEISNRDLARLKLRHILRRTRSLVYKHFMPNANLQKGEFRVKQLWAMKAFKNERRGELNNFLASVNFDDTMDEDIDDILQGCDLHQPAHPVPDVEATITNMPEFEQLLVQSDIPDDYAETCFKTAKSYFKLLCIVHTD